MLLEGIQQLVEKSFAREQRALVHLLLPEVVIVVHGLHESTEEVYAGVAYPVVFTAQCPHDLATYHLSETVGEGGSEGGRGGGRDKKRGERRVKGRAIKYAV